MTIAGDPLSPQTSNTFFLSMLVFMHLTYWGHQSKGKWFLQTAHLPVSAFKTYYYLCTGSHLVLSGHHYSHSPLLSLTSLTICSSLDRSFEHAIVSAILNRDSSPVHFLHLLPLCTSYSKNPRKQYLCSLHLIAFLLISLKPASSSFSLNLSWKWLLSRLPMTSILLCPIVGYQSSSYLNCQPHLACVFSPCSLICFLCWVSSVPYPLGHCSLASFAGSFSSP